MEKYATLQLDAEGNGLAFTIDSDRWCICELITETETIPLGADLVKNVAGRLKRGLEIDPDEGKGSGYIDGHKVRWLLSLFEHHCVLYIATDHQPMPPKKEPDVTAEEQEEQAEEQEEQAHEQAHEQVHEQGEGRILFWEDARGNFFARMHLSPQQRREWIRQLDELLLHWGGSFYRK